jgi:antitoxin ParD1/3/4
VNIDLPSDMSEFVKGLVSQGRFNTEEEAVAEGIRLLISREKLRNELQKGITQLDDGQSFDEESVFSEVNEAIDEIESS